LPHDDWQSWKDSPRLASQNRGHSTSWSSPHHDRARTAVFGRQATFQNSVATELPMMPTRMSNLNRICFASLACLLAITPASAELLPRAAIPLVTAAEGLYGGGLRVSPDNTKVFFIAQEESPIFASKTRLYEVPIVGGPITTRTNEANGFLGSVHGYGFSPNGRDLVFKDLLDNCLCFHGDAFVMPITPGPPKKLTFGGVVVANPGWQPSFSKDGNRLLFLGVGFNQPPELFSVPLDSSTPATPLNNPLPRYYDEVRADWKFLPGGNEVLYVAPQAGDVGYNLFKVNASGGTPQRLNLSDGLHIWRGATNSFAVDTLGSRVAYGAHVGPAGLPTVMSRLLAGGPEVELTPDFAKHEDIQIQIEGFARDQLVFEADFNNAYQYELYAAPADGGPARKISDTYNYIADSASISPNGDGVFFTSFYPFIPASYPDAAREVLFYDVAAGSIHSLGVYSPNSINPFIQFNPAGDLFVLSGSGVVPKLFNARGNFIRSLDYGLAGFHPDGEHFFSLRNPAGASDYQLELFMERLDGTGSAIHVSNDSFGGSGVGEFTFTNDGTTLLYSRIDFGQPLQIYTVAIVPEPGAKVVLAAAVMCLSVVRPTRSRPGHLSTTKFRSRGQKTPLAV
jgi:hypothetical protein